MASQASDRHLGGLAIVITGGLGEIGMGVTSRLLDAGADVSVWDLLDADAGAERLAKAGLAAGYQRVDVTDASVVQAALAERRLDVMLVNAGISRSSPFVDIDLDAWEEQVRTNLTGSFLTAQAAARTMIAAGTPGRIIFTGSWIGETPWPEEAAYSATKAGIRMLARTMALELAQAGILVNVVAPGIVDAGMARRQRLEEPQYARRVARAVPLGRLQATDEVARVVEFLCSAGAGYITGTVLLADGGASLGDRS